MAKRITSKNAIGAFTDGGGVHPNFRFTRYFRKSPTQSVPPLCDIILPKLSPAPVYQGTDAPLPRCDIVLPCNAPGDIFDAQTLLARFDATPPLKEDIYAAFKITFEPDQPAHAGWEMVRGWVRQHFAKDRGLAGIMVLHRPGLAGSSNAAHVHIYVPARLLTVNGFTGNAGRLCSDQGHLEAWTSWSAHKALEDS